MPAILYNMLDVQLFLLPQRLHSREHNNIYNRGKHDRTHSNQAVTHMRYYRHWETPSVK